MVDVFSKQLGIDIRIINIYGPCHNCVLFWEAFMGFSFFTS